MNNVTVASDLKLDSSDGTFKKEYSVKEDISLHACVAATSLEAILICLY